MPASWVQDIAGTATANNPTSAAFPAATTSGNLILVVTCTDAGVVNYVTQVTDSKGNTYTRLTSTEWPTVDVWYAKLTNGGTGHTLTFGWSNAAAGRLSWVAQEFSGVDQANPIDVATGLVYGNNTSPTSPSATPSVADAIAVGCFGHGGASTTYTAGSGYSNLRSGGGSTAWAVMESKPLSVIAAQTAGLTLGATREWAAGLVILRAAGAEPPPPPAGSRSAFFALLTRR